MSKIDSVHFIEECYLLYEQKMYRVAFAILNDSTAAEDAVQDAFLKLMKSRKTFADAKSDDCKRYIISVIKSSAISIYRIRKRDFQLISLSDHEEVIRDQSAESNNEEAIDIEAILDTLPDKYKDVVKCMVVDNMSVRETSVTLSISESSVRKRFERAKKKLKVYVQKKDRKLLI